MNATQQSQSSTQFTPASNIPLLPATTLTRPAPVAYLYAPMNRPAGYGTAPEGFTVVSEEQTDFTPYGTISYPRQLTARECFKWELKSLFDDFKVGDRVEWCEHGGEVFESAIYQIDDSWSIWADEYTKLPFWRLHLVEQSAAADELPAKMPRTERKLIMSRDGYPLGILDVETDTAGAIMDEDTNPIIETPAAKYATGETVTFNYFRDPNYSHEVYQGAIMERVFDRLCGWMYRIDPAPCAFNLSPRWISERYVRETLSVEVVANLRENDHVNALYDAMKMAEQVHSDLAKLDTFDLPADHATYKRKVAAHVAFLRAQAAYLGISNDVIIAYLYGKSALQSRQKTDSSPSSVSQATASEMADTPAPLTQADASPSTRKTGVVSYYDRLNGYGYIKADGESYYFQPVNLRHYATRFDLERGAAVTFAIWDESISGSPKAIDIVLEGVIPAARPAYQAPKELTTEARSAARHTTQARSALKTQKAAQNAANAASFANMPRKEAN